MTRVSVFALAAQCVFLMSGCERSQPGPQTQPVVTVLEGGYILQDDASIDLKEIDTSADLKKVFDSRSLGDPEVIVVTSDRSTMHFVQTFPFSGVRASRLYVYQSQGSENVAHLVGIWHIESNDRIKATQSPDGSSIDVVAGDARLSVYWPR